MLERGCSFASSHRAGRATQLASPPGAMECSSGYRRPEAIWTALACGAARAPSANRSQSRLFVRRGWVGSERWWPSPRLEPGLSAHSGQGGRVRLVVRPPSGAPSAYDHEWKHWCVPHHAIGRLPGPRAADEARGARFLTQVAHYCLSERAGNAPQEENRVSWVSTCHSLHGRKLGTFTAPVMELKLTMACHRSRSQHAPPADESGGVSAPLCLCLGPTPVEG